jgi:hypothetical protein
VAGGGPVCPRRPGASGGLKNGAEGGSRTRTPLRAGDFESPASASSATSAPAPSILSLAVAKKRLGSQPLAKETRSGRIIVNPAKKLNRFALGIAKHPARPPALRNVLGDGTAQASTPLNRDSHPLDERGARRNEAHVQALVHILLVLRRMVAVAVDCNRSIPVDARANKIRHPHVRNGQGAERKGLGGHKADTHQPFVKPAVAPLKTIADATRTAAIWRDGDSEPEAVTNRGQQIHVFGRNYEVPTIPREAPVCRDDTDRLMEGKLPFSGRWSFLDTARRGL